MNKRKDYPDQRKYKSYQLKWLLRMMENNLNDLTSRTLILTLETHLKKLKETKEMLDEISLRLD